MAILNRSLAENMTRSSPFSSRYRFNPALGGTGRYIDRDGKMVTQGRVTNELEKVITGTKQEMLALSEQLQAGDVGIQEWYNGMRSRMKIIHSISASIAKGGWAQMAQADWGSVGAITKKQYKLLGNFASEIISGKQKLDGRFLARVGMYTDAARSTGEDIKRREAQSLAITHERRILGTADHCRTDKNGLLGCVELAGKGWMPVGELPPIGQTPCRTNCKCSFIFGRIENGEVIEVT